MNSCDYEARISGAPRYPNLRGTIRFVPTAGGMVVQICVQGLPSSDHEGCLYGFYIETCGVCSPYGPLMPPLLSAGGTATMTFLACNIHAHEIEGARVLITAGTDGYDCCRGCVLAQGIVRPDPCIPPRPFPPDYRDCPCDRRPLSRPEHCCPPTPPPCRPFNPRPLYPRPFPDCR